MTVFQGDDTMAETFGEYLRSLRGNLSLREVADRTQNKITHSAIDRAEKGKNTHGQHFVPKPETLKELSLVYNVSYDDLMKRAGYLDPQYTPTQVEAPRMKIAKMKIPVYGTIHAGTPTYADENIIGHVADTEEFVDRYGAENLFAPLVKGDSMSKVVPEGYIAVFAKDQEINNGDIVAMLLEENAGIKRYRKTSEACIFEPDSYNPVYQPIIMPQNKCDEVRILGKFLYATSKDI